MEGTLLGQHDLADLDNRRLLGRINTFRKIIDTTAIPPERLQDMVDSMQEPLQVLENEARRRGLVS